MKPDRVEEAIAFAHRVLERKVSRWRDGKTSGVAQALFWRGFLAWGNRVGIPRIDPEKPGHLRVLVQVNQIDGPSDSVTINDNERRERLIDKARKGDRVATKLLCDAAAEFIEEGKQLPQGLRAYIVEVLRKPDDTPKKRGQDPFANYPRNFDIACTIANVVSMGFKATRNQATEAESACSIVQQALERVGVHMSEANVEKIWERLAPDFH